MKKEDIKRAKELLAKMSTEEKLYQLTSQMIYSIDENYDKERDPMRGNYRNPGHFMHHKRPQPASAREVAQQINHDVKMSIEAQPHSIPPIEHGEALHGAQWGMATSFPQPIGMASSFNDELIDEIADVIGKECAAVGVRQILSPVVNVVRDCRWGRTIETFGEDVLLSSNMGAAICRGLQKNGVIATPKHYADNYSYGGRDSNASDTSERTMREVYLKPFEKCFKEGGALSVMAAYNSWDGVPCSCNEKLMQEILRDEWGFQGFSVSDYGGVEGVCRAHKLTDSYPKAQALCLKAGLDVNLPKCSIDNLKTAYNEGMITDEDLDRAVLRVLSTKFSIGLFDSPFVDPDAAEKLVRCEAHKKLALKAARQSIVLLKNDGILPLNRNKIKKIAVFGAGAHVFPVGKNYSGPYHRLWEAPDAKTPFEYLTEYLDGYAEIVYYDDEMIEKIAPMCDAAIYMTTVVEGEGMDRSDIKLPGVTKKVQSDDNAIIVGKTEINVRTDQEDSIQKMTKANKNSVVVLLNGAPVDMSAWINGCRAIVEAWYPGEQGAQAITEILFGETSPSGKLPITFPKSIGQLPLFYSVKPSGRGYAYVENDGSPLFPFGYGLSYTNFKLDNFDYQLKNDSMSVTLSIENTGDFDGAEIIQIYFTGKNCDVVMPRIELKAYRRVELKSGEKRHVTIDIPNESFCYYDRKMAYGMHQGDYVISIATSSVNIHDTFEVSVKDGSLIAKS